MGIDRNALQHAQIDCATVLSNDWDFVVCVRYVWFDGFFSPKMFPKDKKKIWSSCCSIFLVGVHSIAHREWWNIYCSLLYNRPMPQSSQSIMWTMWQYGQRRCSSLHKRTINDHWSRARLAFYSSLSGHQPPYRCVLVWWYDVVDDEAAYVYVRIGKQLCVRICPLPTCIIHFIGPFAFMCMGSRCMRTNEYFERK